MNSPRDILLWVEDNSDHPAHVISPRLVDKALEALAAEGYIIAPRELLEQVHSRLAASEYYSDGRWADELGKLLTHGQLER